jgi:hypothetical protein
MHAHALFNFVYAFALVAATVVTHAAGIIAFSWCLIRFGPWASRHFGFFHDAGLSITVIAVLIVLHLIEVAWWSLFYMANANNVAMRRSGCIRRIDCAFVRAA